MPAITKAKPEKKTLVKKPKVKVPKAKTISSQLGVVAVKKTSLKHPYNPVKANRGVVYLSNIPHGFYEDQLKAYFSQFGPVTRTLVARSEKSGKSKGYAYVEFKVPDVAKIAAETMDNYIMFKQVLRATYIAPEDQKFNYFRAPVRFEKDADGTRHLVTPKTKRTEQAIRQINKMPTKKQHDNRVARALYKIKKAQEVFATKNIQLDMSSVAHGKIDAPAVPEVVVEGKKSKKTTRKVEAASKIEAAAPRVVAEGKLSKKTTRKIDAASKIEAAAPRVVAEGKLSMKTTRKIDAASKFEADAPRVVAKGKISKKTTRQIDATSKVAAKPVVSKAKKDLLIKTVDESSNLVRKISATNLKKKLKSKAK